jgi:hypothetical protein
MEPGKSIGQDDQIQLILIIIIIVNGFCRYAEALTELAHGKSFKAVLVHQVKSFLEYLIFYGFNFCLISFGAGHEALLDFLFTPLR